jgi:L-threonylcarbamoyladenylate synthase
VGLESTIVACLDEPRLLRPGGITRERLEAVLGQPLATSQEPGLHLAPGLMASHYAPRAALRLEAMALEEEEAGLDFGGRFAGTGGACLDLSPGRDLGEAAANLFGFLRRLDAAAARIAVAPVPRIGLGDAINDRLKRAAAPRSGFP